MIAVAAVYLLLLAVKGALAWRHERGEPAGEAGPVTIVQPILAGDPRLEEALRRNVAAHPEAEFLWLVDTDDAEGRAVAARQATARVRVVTGPGPVDGENPKIAKLARALPLVGTVRLVVLDDDSVLLPGALARLAGADLATGLPTFAAGGSFYERLVAGFVNGSALLTYFPAAALGVQRTINGMVYAVEPEVLRELGGFEAIRRELTDDYAIARLYETQGRTVRQTAAFVEVGMTIASAGHCARVMRRWMIFANRYLRENFGVATVVLVAAPALLPFVLLAGAPGWALGCLGAKALVNRGLLWSRVGRRPRVGEALFEMLADLLLPVWLGMALVRPNRMTWRSRRIQMTGGEIRYE